ncbi:type II toxin-antitoxin system PemK/MazF family toxin [Cellulomonas chengniuliangii]|uniref:type II toxin-antitoxin system PemK/MazF family toxin n=1 Tax=Cellulomonas chengniuliangii TaxID=2968084 RepID=UPI001D0EB3E1|nr:type II toxin-antitoxin system PemK/MazF family toxin [Cellulomonas chengniuliangii]MCC2318237.1 type II toxin-antitoxin system PemK/MazF family toxin [Cellulomonas chengniuliangii]
MASGRWGRAIRAVLRRADASVRARPERGRAAQPAARQPAARQPAPRQPAPRQPTATAWTAPGDHTGPVRAEYTPRLDGDADPGEVVWTWVAYEDDPSRGKDRPVLVIARDGRWLLGLMLTSKDHDLDAADEARHGRRWVDIGAGAWDARGRPSEVRLDRVLRIDPAAVRREGAVLDRAVFDRVVRAL